MFILRGDEIRQNKQLLYRKILIWRLAKVSRKKTHGSLMDSRDDQAVCI